MAELPEPENEDIFLAEVYLPGKGSLFPRETECVLPRYTSEPLIESPSARHAARRGLETLHFDDFDAGRNRGAIDRHFVIGEAPREFNTGLADDLDRVKQNMGGGVSKFGRML